MFVLLDLSIIHHAIAIMECNINILLSSCFAITGILWSYYNPTINTSLLTLTWTIQNKDIIHALSAAIGSVLSITLLYPLETIRTRMQVDVSDGSRGIVYTIISIFRKEGLVQGLYKGWFSLVVALWSLNFVYFYFFHALRRWVENLDTSFNNQTVIDLLVGYGAGVIAVLITGPLWLGTLFCVSSVFACLVSLGFIMTTDISYHMMLMYAVNTRLKLQGIEFKKATEKDGSKKSNAKQQQQYTGIIQCLYKISSEEGMLTLWNGTLTSIILCFNPAINLGIYMMLKRHRFLIDDIVDNHSDSIAPFINSFISKFIATIVTYPIQVLQTRHRASVKIKEGTSNQQSWLRSLFRGLNSKLLQTCLNSAIMFVLYERLVDILSAIS